MAEGFEDNFAPSSGVRPVPLQFEPPPDRLPNRGSREHVKSLEMKLERMKTKNPEDEKRLGREMAREMSRSLRARDKQRRDEADVNYESLSDVFTSLRPPRSEAEPQEDRWSESDSDSVASSISGKESVWERLCVCFASKRRLHDVIPDRERVEGDEGFSLIEQECTDDSS
eukprot:m.115441 g.115441  ORF g.115441 m.115441 type:complete len:171 (+) comp37544_c0_seq21:33-545(+)